MNNLLAKKDLSAEQLSMVQSEVSKQGKSKGIAYALWFFLGGLGGHRYYAGNIGMAIAMTLTLGGLGIWSLIDVFMIGGAIEKKNEEIEFKAIQLVKSLNN
ncbi:TM2 domain-containing protein [Priestia megaterium]|uniref:TM2 domain-containing protein n=1 Tax=Priestia megaterium TaxID=1404 RepID=UPI00234F8B7D|nr:TM2 domain-containing protein [Priestia megaterium]MDC7783916.1 TM2 domain-containing protein [Priestia megaterium]MDI3090171.1 TM2 domain-containing protein [Priestia megaterium]